MSAQINLFHSRFLKRTDALSLGRVVAVAVAVLGLQAAGAGGAGYLAASREKSAAAVKAELAAVQAEVDVATNANAARKPDPRMIEELERTRESLRRRSEILRLLDSGAVGSTEGFAGYLRGFARQVPEGLWLTGFSIGPGGGEMEIRGAMLNPAALPDYIGRLGKEKAFQGRQFSALTMNRPATPADALAAKAGPAVAAAPVGGSPSRAIEFVLSPRPIEAREVKP